MATTDSCSSTFFFYFINAVNLKRNKVNRWRSYYTMTSQQYSISAWMNMVEVNKSPPRLNLRCVDEYTLAELG